MLLCVNYVNGIVLIAIRYALAIYESYQSQHMSFTSIGVDVKILTVLSEDQTKDTLWIKAMNDEKLTEFSFLDYDQLMKQTVKHHSKEESWEQVYLFL